MSAQSQKLLQRLWIEPPVFFPVAVVFHLKKYDIEQIPVMDGREPVGAITQNGLFKALLEDAGIREKSVGDAMEAPLPTVEMDTRLDRLTKYISKDAGAVLARDESGDFHILTKYDVLNALGK